MHHAASHARFKATQRKLVVTILALQLAMTLLQFALPATVLAQQNEVSVEVIPASVDLPPNGQVEVRVLVNNLSKSTLQDIHLTSFTNIGVNVTINSPSLDTLTPGGMHIWSVQLSQITEGTLSGTGTVQFQVNYKLQVGGQPGLIQHVAFSSLTVKSLGEQVAEMQVITSLVTLDQQHPGRVYLLITNKSDFLLMIKKLTMNEPGFIELSPEKFMLIPTPTPKPGETPIPRPNEALPDGMLTILPHQAGTITIDVKAKDTVQPGKHLLVFEVALEWGFVGQMREGNLVASKEIDVEVLGESQLLTLLAIPSLLVLPGFLALVTWQLLSELNSKRHFPLKANSPQFGLIAITLSIIAFFAYPIITGLTGVRRDFLVAYGLRDIVSIWLGSIVSAGVLYFLYSLSVRLYNFYLKPSANDRPTTILRKLKRQHLSAMCTTVMLEVGGEKPKVKAYLLEPHKESQEEFWVSPKIIVKLLDNCDESLLHELNKYIDMAATAYKITGADTLHLADLLDQGDGVSWNVDWNLESLKPHKGPFKVKNENIDFLQQELIVKKD